jgi:tetratricopeptide (TPR) repeat protein
MFTLLLGLLTLKQLRIWQDSITLWSYVISDTPIKLDFAYNNRAIAWHRIGNFDRALEDFEFALQIKPNFGDYLNNRGNILIKMHRYDEALFDYKKAIELNSNDHGPIYNNALYNIACIYSLRNDISQACDWFRKSVDYGYNRWQDIKADHDLDNIRSKSCYQEIMAGK